MYVVSSATNKQSITNYSFVEPYMNERKLKLVPSNLVTK